MPARSRTANFNSNAGATDHGANGDDPVTTSLHSLPGAPILPSIAHGPGGQEVGGAGHLSGSLLDASAAHESGGFAELIRAANAPVQSGLVAPAASVGSAMHADSHLLSGSVAGHDLGSADMHVAAASPAFAGVHEVHLDQHAVAAPMVDHAAASVHH
jgi:hypothetical protein